MGAGRWKSSTYGYIEETVCIKTTTSENLQGLSNNPIFPKENPIVSKEKNEKEPNKKRKIVGQFVNCSFTFSNCNVNLQDQ